MFGYIKTQKSELRVREFDCYRATYCGLCHAMGKTCGRSFCGTLSYDFAFLGVIRMALTDRVPEFEKKRCIAHPFRKRMAVKTNESLVYCSAAAALLGYGKCRDDISDEKGGARIKARLALPYFASARKRALKKMPELIELDDKVSRGLASMSELETKDPEKVSADALGELFGGIMGDILSFGLEGGNRIAAKKFGEAIGRWLYVMDAVDDYEDDVKKGRFNPFVIFWKDSGGFTDERRELIEAAMTAYLLEAERALDLMELGGCREFFEIIRNVLYLGMPFEAKKALSEIKA